MQVDSPSPLQQALLLHAEFILAKPGPLECCHKNIRFKKKGGGGVRQTRRVIVESRFRRLRDNSWGMIHKDVSNSAQLIKLHKVFTKIIHRDDSESIAAKLSTRTVHDSQG